MPDITLGTIYEDVAALQEQVAQLQVEMVAAQETITALQGQVVSTVALTSNTDLNSLGVGKYYIPNATVCGTLLNKPVTSNATGYVEVIEGGADGQLNMYYIPCMKDTPTYYHRAFYQGSWGNWNTVNLVDSGWIDLTLVNGAEAYSEAQKPRYRRVGKEVFIAGVFKGVTASNTTIATLPSGYRPSKKVLFAVAAVGQIISRISIDTDGTIAYNRSTYEPIIAENYHSIACTFNVD